MVRTFLEIEGGSEFILIHNNIFEFGSYVKGSVLSISYIKSCLILKTTVEGRDLSVSGEGVAIP